MTISTTIVKNSYSGDGSTSTFSYTFKVLAEADLTVIIRDSLGTETTKTLTTHYTITGVGDANGGSITFTAGNIPSATDTVVLIRDTAQIQSIDYIANDPFPAETHEEGLDRSVILAQELQEEVNRSIKISRTNTMTNTEFTVGPSDRAGKFLSFDSNGELVVSQEVGTYRGNWSTGTTYAARDIVKDTSTNNIFLCNTGHTSSGSEPLTTNTDSAKWDLLVDAAAAATSATAAAASATAAATSETNAATSETNAATSETNAAASETAAATSETNAATSATNAATSASNAATSESNASTSETNAASSATAAASSATSAATQASNAATSATNAATSETNAASSASAASTSASNASTSETNAASSASSASTSATNASNAQTAAETAQAAAELAYDNFDDRYLGPKASDPTLDNDGDALIDGALYFNTTGNVLKYWDGSAWQNVEATDTSSFATNGFAIAMAIAL
jgi:DNA polymerase III gamma/tau subunit